MKFPVKSIVVGATLVAVATLAAPGAVLQAASAVLGAVAGFTAAAVHTPAGTATLTPRPASR